MRSALGTAGGMALTGTLCAGMASVPGVAFGQAAQSRPEEIIVTSNLLPTPRRQIGTAVDVLDGPTIELKGDDSLADVLRTQTGIAVSNSGGPGKPTALRIRGEEGYRTLLIIDGLRMVDVAATQVSPDFSTLLTAGDLERVEVLRGPQGFMYGADAGGVVNIITGQGKDALGGRVDLEAGEFDTRKIDGSISGSGDQGDYYVSATELKTDGFNATTADTVLRDKDGADNTTVHAKFGFNPTEQLRLQLVARDVNASTRYDGCFDPATFAIRHDCSNTTKQNAYRLSADHKSGRLSNSFGYSSVDIDRNDYAGSAFAFGSQGSMSRLEYTGSFEASAAATLVYGLDLEDEEMFSGGQKLTQGQDGYYFEYQGAFGKNFFLTAGARYDDNDDFGTHLSSRVSAAYSQPLSSGNSIKYRASVGNGFRAPSLFEVSYNHRPFGVIPAAAAGVLTEETSNGYDLGVEYDSANGLHLEATYFDQKIGAAIDYSFDLNTFNDGYVKTPGTSMSKGLELGAEVPISNGWAFIGNWTSNDAKTANGQRRVRRPKHIGNLGVQRVSSDGAFKFLANYRLSKDAVDMDFNTGAFFDIGDYEVLDLSFSYALNKTFELYGRVLNATEENYREVAGYNTGGRQIYAGLRLRF
ncbi:MAG: TonB-dependent receptor [Gammaproteobacteria bacterium]